MTLTDESFVIKDHDPALEAPHASYKEGLGVTKPEIHCSAGQTPEQVKELLHSETPDGKAQEEEKQILAEAEAILDKELPGWRDDPEKAKEAREQRTEGLRAEREKAKKEQVEVLTKEAERMFKEAAAKGCSYTYSRHMGSDKWRQEVDEIKSDLRWYENVPGKLSYEDEAHNDSQYQPDIRPRSKSRFDGQCHEVCADWRALAGLCPSDEIVEKEPVVMEIMESIKVLISQRVPGLTAEWGGDCWNKSLMLNGAKTSVCGVGVKQAYEGLKGIASEIEAAKSVTELVVNRVTSLFAAV